MPLFRDGVMRLSIYCFHWVRRESQNLPFARLSNFRMNPACVGRGWLHKNLGLPSRGLHARCLLFEGAEEKRLARLLRERGKSAL